MYTLLRSLPLRRITFEQVPALGGAMLVAELFYKLHSFTLECALFLLTWLAFDAAVQAVVALYRRRHPAVAYSESSGERGPRP